MKVAVTYENGEIFQHFGRTEQFKIYGIEDKKIVSTEIIGNNGQGHGALVGYLKQQGVSALICGGIGGGARQMLADQGISVYPGASGDADANVKSFVCGELSYDPETTCHHHEESHSCTCGKH
jgi:predicted Fe-Mo cluster-binding NifX family protein